jgi:drug/metabolite transporter (DMT)-like permease
MPRSVTRVRQLFKEDWKVVFLACALGAFSNLSLNAALSLHDAASVLVINEVFLILVLVGEHIYLKERERTWIKLLSIVLAIAGAILIEISH